MPAPIVAALVSTGMGVIGDLIDRAFPNSAEREQKRLEYELKFQEAANQINLAQIAVNQEEAKSDNIFVAGWRPAIGWVCAFAFAYKFTIQPFLIFIMVASGSQFDADDLPILDWSEMSPVLIGLLGLGTLKTVEKVKASK